MDKQPHLHPRFNLLYIVLILVLTIIFLIILQWGAVPEFVKYITFGLTIASLFLYLIAIISSIFFSKKNNDLNRVSQAPFSEIDKDSSEKRFNS